MHEKTTVNIRERREKYFWNEFLLMLCLITTKIRIREKATKTQGCLAHA